jgi:hypothetical protein
MFMPNVHRPAARRRAVWREECASAKIRLHMAADRRLVRVGIRIQKGLGAHDHAGDAVAALCCLLIGKGALQRTHPFGGAQPFHSAHRPASEGTERRDAGKNRLPVQLHGAGAALPQAASIFRAIQFQRIA